MTKCNIAKWLGPGLFYAGALVAVLAIACQFEKWRARMWADQMNAVIENAVNKAKKP